MSDISVTLPPEEDASWLFSKEEIADSPSRVDHVSVEEENECRKGASMFIQTVGLQLRLPQLTIATALLFYHRFFALHSLKQYPLLDMSTACLFVAAKLEETPKKLRELVMVAYAIQYPDRPGLTMDSAEFKRERDHIVSLERDLLQALCFDFQIDHPYRYLLHYVKQLQGGKELAQSAWSFANDSFRTTLPLQYYARVIGMGCVYLAANMMLHDKAEHEWSNILGVELDILEDISRQLMDLYKSNKTEVKSSGDEAKSNEGNHLLMEEEKEIVQEKQQLPQEETTEMVSSEKQLTIIPTHVTTLSPLPLKKEPSEEPKQITKKHDLEPHRKSGFERDHYRERHSGYRRSRSRSRSRDRYRRRGIDHYYRRHHDDNDDDSNEEEEDYYDRGRSSYDRYEDRYYRRERRRRSFERRDYSKYRSDRRNYYE
jgi:protein BUR2